MMNDLGWSTDRDWEEEYKSKGNVEDLRNKFNDSDLCTDPRESL